MEHFKAYCLNVIAFLFLQIGIAQTNDTHIVKAPTKELKMMLFSQGKPVLEGTVVAVGTKLINHGMFVVYAPDGFILQTIQYNMGKIIKITTFSEEDKI